MRISTKLLLLAVAVAGLMGPAIGTRTEDLSPVQTVEVKPKPVPTLESVCKEINAMYKEHPDATLEDVAEHIEEKYDATVPEAVEFYNECKVKGYDEKHYHQGDTKPADPPKVTPGGVPVKPSSSGPAGEVPVEPSSSGPAGEADKKL